MAKRKFSGQKLYQLLKAAVIILTVFSWIVYYYEYKIGGSVSIRQSGDMWEKCQLLYPGDKKKQYEESYDKCLEPAVKKLEKQRFIETNSLRIGIILPVIFIFGTQLFNYLFPGVKKKK